MAEELFDVVGLLDGDGDADGVDGGLDEDALLLVPGDDHRVQQRLLRLPHLKLYQMKLLTKLYDK